ncbi:hypothetical protein EB118_10445 [bacterium]|nr:hypothetical protein [bacterium]
MKLSHIFLNDNEVGFFVGNEMLALGSYEDLKFNMFFNNEIKSFGNAMKAFSFLNEYINTRADAKWVS